jgi:hypothetical protein
VDLLDPADIVATRAIGIDAPASAIWPWLVQMGPGRAGAYTYDWIENRFGLNMHSADQLRAEWQNLKVGDVLRSREDRPGMRVEILDPERTLSNRSEAGDWVWTFVLVPEDGSTRLISRNRIAMKGGGGRPAPGHARNGTRLARHGAEDAARDQATSRAVTPAALTRRRAPPPSRDIRVWGGGKSVPRALAVIYPARRERARDLQCGSRRYDPFAGAREHSARPARLCP